MALFLLLGGPGILVLMEVKMRNYGQKKRDGLDYLVLQLTCYTMLMTLIQNLGVYIGLIIMYGYGQQVMEV